MPHRKGGKEETKWARAWQARNLPAHAAAERRYEAANAEEVRRRKREAWRLRKYGTRSLPDWARKAVGNLGRRNIGLK